MTRLELALALIGLALLGFLRVLSAHRELLEQRSFGLEYLERFRKLASSIRSGLDLEAYGWLTERVIRMQRDLGSMGVAMFRPPFEGYVVHNYQLIVNTLPKMRGGVAEWTEISGCEEAIVRYMGVLEDLGKIGERDLRNPIVWFREGVAGVLSLPFRLLSWFGLASSALVGRIGNSLLFRLASRLVGLVGFLAALVTLFLGWTEARRLLRSMVEKLLG